MNYGGKWRQIKGVGVEGGVMEGRLLCAMCELKTMYPRSTERSTIDRWIEGGTMEEIDSERGESEGE